MSSLYELAKKTQGSSTTFSKGLTLLTRKKHFLETVFLQLTPACNFSCKMCYAKMTADEISKSGVSVLRFDDWKYYIDSAADMGVLTLVLTGGECTLHPDFKKIYEYAYDRGLSVYVMTNASNIDDDLVSLWKRKPPQKVSMTVYGASYETYSHLCGNGNACAVVYDNIEKLLRNHIAIYPKYNTVKENYKDLPAVSKYFQDKGIEIAVAGDLLNFGKCDGDTVKSESVDSAIYEELSLKLWCEKYGKTISEGKEIRKKALEATIRSTPLKPLYSKGVRCSAGTNVCHINWQGLMTPCVSITAFLKDPREIGFKESWELLGEWAKEVPCLEECQCCYFRSKCTKCISFHYNDTGMFGKPSPRLCWKRKNPVEAEAIIQECIAKGIIRIDTETKEDE